MCGRYAVYKKVAEIEEEYNLDSSENTEYEANYNISPGDKAPVITNTNPKKLSFFRFGLCPHWAKKPMYLFNARSEGDFNKENDILYQGEKGIKDKPSFRKPIRSQRCLIPANGFIEGDSKEKLNKPFWVYPVEKDLLFSFAGIWDTWVSQETGEMFDTFAIITTTPNQLLQKIPHHRSPVILNKEDEKKWLSDIHLDEILDLLKPFPDKMMQAYPIDKQIKNPRVNSPGLLKAVGETIF